MNDLEIELSKILETGRLYWHCCYCGVVFDDNKYDLPLFNIMEETGDTFLSQAFSAYSITSGVCKPCYEIAIEEINKRKQNVRSKI